MTGEEPKTTAAPIPASNQGNGTANSVSQGKTITVSGSGAFVRCGEIEMHGRVLKMTYRSFGQEHEGAIPARELMRLQEPGAMPAEVVRTHEGIDGAEVVESIGKAWRSRSGRALVIRTIDSQGEIMVPWSRFMQTIRGAVKKAIVSRLEAPSTTPSPTPPVARIHEGLERGF